MKKALITGVTGQDGFYLAKLLLEKGYEVHGLVRRSSSTNLQRIRSFLDNDSFKIHYGDLLDSVSLTRLVGEVKPDEVYNLGAMSHVRQSFDFPEYCGDVDALGVLRLLEAIRLNKLEKTTRFYQASTSELYGKVHAVPQSEETPFHPRSPYAVAKIYGYWATVNYREAYDMFACNGILFNHESPMRGEDFVTRKISLAVANIKKGNQECLYLGNLEAKRDWGYAPDYVEGMWRMLQSDTARDYVLATGETHTVREFVEAALKTVDIPFEWKGEKGSKEEYALNTDNGQKIVAVNPHFYRPAEVDLLIGDPTRAKEELGWQASTSFQDLVSIMVKHDLENPTW